ncbi:MAG: HEAT repeat domain-containing protein [Planctomycetes bacterium]|nr:HEAT repeat domain-containing protein [Planctomycetota bacterium]
MAAVDRAFGGVVANVCRIIYLVGHLMMVSTIPRRVFWCAVLMAVGACAPTAGDLVQRLEDRDPLTRIRAITQITRARQTDLIPKLVDRLEDEDSAVRFVAIFALEELTGSHLGYDYAAPKSERVKAVAAWREFVLRQDATATAEVGSSP